MSTPVFDFASLVNNTLSAIGNVLSQIVTALSDNAATIGAIVGAIVVAGVAFSLMRRTPFIGRLIDWLGGIFRF